MNEGRKIVTFSFDDGFPKDQEVASLFEQHHFVATFYFPQDVKHGKIRDRMTKEQMQEFALKHPTMEIGQHGFNHLFLTQVSFEDAVTDIQLGHAWHRETFGEAPKSFAYPRGYYTKEIADVVQALGYTSARTTVSQNKLQRKQYEIGGTHFPIDQVTFTDKMNIWGHSWELGHEDMIALESLLTMLKYMKYESVTNAQYADIFYPR